MPLCVGACANADRWKFLQSGSILILLCFPIGFEGVPRNAQFQNSGAGRRFQQGLHLPGSHPGIPSLNVVRAEKPLAVEVNQVRRSFRHPNLSLPRNGVYVFP